MFKAYSKPEIYLLEDVEEDVITASIDLGDNDTGDIWGEELPDDF